MLTCVELDLFKCFEQLKLPLSPLTLLSGSNASGKSTVIQSLVLLNQAILGNEWSLKLPLNGPDLQLGTLTEVVDKLNGRSMFSIGVADGNHTCNWTIEDDRRAMSAQITAVLVDGQRFQPPYSLQYLLPPGSDAAPLAEKLRAISYVTAERTGPRETYPVSDQSGPTMVGARGENAVGIMFARQQQSVREGLVIEGNPPTLFHQVNAWMNKFFPGFALEVQPVPKTNLLTLGLRTSEATDFHRPVHVGFGLTQALPIVVAALDAAPGTTLLVENPEVHLHPASQALMGKFLARVAASGVQVILETHSDHVLNGVRRAVKQKVTPSELVQFHFFRKRTNAVSQVVSPEIDAHGRVGDWPDGFFDQFDKDAQYFAGWED